MGELLPWGLTLGQTLFIGIGAFMLLGGWVLLTSLLRLSKNLLMCGLIAILALTCCASAALAIFEITR